MISSINLYSTIVQRQKLEDVERDYYIRRIEEQIFSSFQVDYAELLKLEFIFTYKLHVSPIDMDQMEFFRVQYMAENYNEEIKRDEEQKKMQHKAEEAEQKRQESKAKRESSSQQKRYK